MPIRPMPPKCPPPKCPPPIPTPPKWPPPKPPPPKCPPPHPPPPKPPPCPPPPPPPPPRADALNVEPAKTTAAAVNAINTLRIMTVHSHCCEVPPSLYEPRLLPLSWSVRPRSSMPWLWDPIPRGQNSWEISSALHRGESAQAAEA